MCVWGRAREGQFLSQRAQTWAIGLNDSGGQATTAVYVCLGRGRGGQIFFTTSADMGCAVCLQMLYAREREVETSVQTLAVRNLVRYLMNGLEELHSRCKICCSTLAPTGNSSCMIKLLEPRAPARMFHGKNHMLHSKDCLTQRFERIEVHDSHFTAQGQ